MEWIWMAALAGSTLRVGDALPTTLLPLHARTDADWRAAALLYDPLFEQGPFSSDLTSVLVERYARPSPEVLVLTVKESLKWADGHPVDAADICFTLDALLHPDNDVSWAAPQRRVIDRCVASEDGREARVRFVRPLPDPRAWLTVPVLPAHAFAGPTVPVDHPFSTQAFGSRGSRGRLEAEQLVVERSQATRRGIQRIDVRPDRGVADLQDGRVHVLVTLPRDALSTVREQPGLEVRPYPTSDIWLLALRRSGVLASLDSRVALDRALDRTQLLEEVWGVPEGPSVTSQAPLRGPFADRSPLHDPSLQPRAPRTEPLELGSLRLGVGEAQEALAPGLAEALARQLRQRGTAVEVVRLPGDPLREGSAAQAEVDLLLVRWAATLPEQVAPLFAADGSHNPFGIHSPATDAALEALESAATEEATRTAAHALQQASHAEVHAIWLVSGGHWSGWSEAVDGQLIAPDAFWTPLHTWTLDD